MTPALLVEPARRGDAGPIARLSRELIEHGLPWRWRPAAVRAAMASDDHLVVVARGERLAAFGLIQILERHAHLALLGVAPRWQRQGLGRLLLQWLEQCALTAGNETIRLEVRAQNTAARAFYRAQGYREVAELPRYYDRRETAVQMARCLVAPAAERWAAAERLVAAAIEAARGDG